MAGVKIVGGAGGFPRSSRWYLPLGLDEAARRARQDESRRELRSASAGGHRGNLSLVKSKPRRIDPGRGQTAYAPAMSLYHRVLDRFIRSPLGVWTELAELHVPASLQAAIAARIDRLGTSVKRTLNAAAVIGLRFGEELLAGLVDNMAVTNLRSNKATITHLRRLDFCAASSWLKRTAYNGAMASTYSPLPVMPCWRSASS